MFKIFYKIRQKIFQTMESANAVINGKVVIPLNGSAFGSFIEPGRFSKHINGGEMENRDIDHQAGITVASSDPKMPAGTSTKDDKYDRLMFRNVIYEIGDTVLIRESPDTNMIARIERIIKEQGDDIHPKWPMIEVTW